MALISGRLAGAVDGVNRSDLCANSSADGCAQCRQSSPTPMATEAPTTTALIDEVPMASTREVTRPLTGSGSNWWSGCCCPTKAFDLGQDHVGRFGAPHRSTKWPAPSVPNGRPESDAANGKSPERWSSLFANDWCWA